MVSILVGFFLSWSDFKTRFFLQKTCASLEPLVTESDGDVVYAVAHMPGEDVGADAGTWGRKSKRDETEYKLDEHIRLLLNELERSRNASGSLSLFIL